MSILIKGMEMPKKCIECKLMKRCGEEYGLDFVCMPASVYVEDLTNAYKPRPDYCPLVFVPPHGRLIDADALPNKYAEVRELAPTIIEAEEEE